MNTEQDIPETAKAIDMANKAMIIGHAAHSKTVLNAAIATMMSNRNAQQTEPIKEVQIPYRAPVPEMYIPTAIESYQGKRTHKPNKGLTLGSYKYKSGRK